MARLSAPLALPLGGDPDSFKAKQLRRMMPAPYDARLSGVLGKLLTVIGAADNEIGGQFGQRDFLPDEQL